jgi:penicillin-binding protein 2
MTLLRNVQLELSRFRMRVLVASMVVVLGFCLLTARLIYLQVVRHEDLQAQAENNRTAIVPVVPNRGLILDRNGIVLASNYSAYTLEVTPSKVANLEQALDDLSQVLEIAPRERKRFKKLQQESKSFESIPLRSRLSDEEVARFAAQRYRFPGMEIKARLFRNYPYGELASHVIGYIGRINTAEKDALEESDDPANYRGTEYIGKLGVEQSFEAQLHGITGVDAMETSAGGHATRRLNNLPATPGNTVTLSIDIKLQKLIEDMFGERRGALVALDPKTGEVLAFVSKPTFDPNLFVEGIDQDNWQLLNESIDKPLLNRALRGTYPPGSTYKPFMALAALTTGKRAPQTIINDPGFYMFGGHRFGSPKDDRTGPMDMRSAIIYSSNAYFYSLANELSVDTMHDFMAPFGFGQITGIDIQGEVHGVLPSQAWKREYYKNPEQQRWYAGETISLGIGQGYNSFTMLQLAQAIATLANNGVKHKPQLVIATQEATSKVRQPVAPAPPIDLGLHPEHMDFVRRAMVGVTQEGTSTRVFAGAGYLSGGKTGTAQAVSLGKNEKYNAARMEERRRDHSLYIAFAPAEDPKIALAIVVENAGFGSTSAAPIARRAFDYWLLGQYPNLQDLELVRTGQAAAPVGKPRVASAVPWPIMAASGAEAPAITASATSQKTLAAIDPAASSAKPASSGPTGASAAPSRR